MKQTKVKTDRQMTCCISGRSCSQGTGHIAPRPGKGLIRHRVGWLFVARNKGLYVPAHLLPDSYTAGWLSGKSCNRTDCRKDKQPDSQTDNCTTESINNRMTAYTSLRIRIRLSRFNNLIFNL
jgi:hypothetical protein